MTTNTLQKTDAKKIRRVKYLTITGLMAAMITIMTAYVCHIHIGVNGSYIHFGDAVIYLAAAMLPTPYAMAAAAIGGGLADLITDPIWAPATIIIKMLITLPFTGKSAKIVTTRNVAAAIVAYFITVVGYFAAEYVLFGAKAALITSVFGNTIQSVGSTVFFIIFGIALDRVHAKAKLISG